VEKGKRQKINIYITLTSVPSSRRGRGGGGRGDLAALEYAS